MEPKFNTSFIPKKSLQDVGGNTTGLYVGRRDVYGPGFFLSLLLFLISIIATIGLFAYSKMIENNIEEQIASLEDRKNFFNSDEINGLIRTDTQIKSARDLVQKHVALSELFNHLEKVTLKRVQYTELQFEGLPAQPALVTLTGTSKKFQDVALQSEQYRSDKNLRSPIVKELERLETGDVHFTIDVVADSELLSFSAMLKRGVQNPAVSTQSVGTTTPNPATVVPNTVPTDQATTINPNSVPAPTTVVEEQPVIDINDTGAFVNTL